MAVGKIRDIQNAENQGKPQSHNGIRAAQHDTVEYLLQKKVHKYPIRKAADTGYPLPCLS